MGEPTAAEDGPVFVITRSAGPCTTAVSVTVLSAGVASGAEAVTDAVFVIVPTAVGVTTMVTRASALGASEPRLHVTVWPTFVHPADALRTLTEAGRLSVTVVSGASSGPALKTEIVYVSWAPTKPW